MKMKLIHFLLVYMHNTCNSLFKLCTRELTASPDIAQKRYKSSYPSGLLFACAQRCQYLKKMNSFCPKDVSFRTITFLQEKVFLQFPCSKKVQTYIHFGKKANAFCVVHLLEIQAFFKVKKQQKVCSTGHIFLVHPNLTRFSETKVQFVNPESFRVF